MKSHLLRKLATLDLRNKRSVIEKGFTLVELIVVVVIIGVLSSIAVPAFNNASDKAKQKEASTLIASYVKATQAFFAENSTLPDYSRDLGQFVNVSRCARYDGNYCKTAQPVDETTSTRLRVNSTWASPSGLYQIYWNETRRGSTNYVMWRALPAGTYANTGFGVTGCFNSATGSTKVADMKNKGRSVGYIYC